MFIEIPSIAKVDLKKTYNENFNSVFNILTPSLDQ